MSHFTKNSDLKDGLKGAFEGININDPKDIPAAISKLLGKMTESAKIVPDAVKRSMEATSDNQGVPSTSSK